MKNVKSINENNVEINEYPCIVEVSQSEDFTNDPHMKKNRISVCIGKLGGKYMCVKHKEEHAEWMLEQIKQSIKSGAISLVLEYWNYARLIENKMKDKETFKDNEDTRTWDNVQYKVKRYEDMV